MKRATLFHITLLALLTLAACNSTSQTTPVPPTQGGAPQAKTLPAMPKPSGGGQAEIDLPFPLRMGEGVTLEAEKLTILFKAVDFDNRCPADVQCVQAGWVSVVLEVQRGDGPLTSLPVSTLPNRPKGIFGEYQIYLSNVAPGPAKLNETIPAELYAITLLVTHLDSVAQARLDHPFQIRGGEEASLEGGKLKVRFVEMEEDSRCPKSVLCEWSGEARIRLEVQAGEAAPVTVAVSTLFMKSMGEAGGYRFELYSVAPYPETPEQEIAFEEYVATVLITAQ